MSDADTVVMMNSNIGCWIILIIAILLAWLNNTFPGLETSVRLGQAYIIGFIAGWLIAGSHYTSQTNKG
jgi:hypothetical protein